MKKKELLIKILNSNSNNVKSKSYFQISELVEEDQERLKYLYLSTKYGGIEASITLLELLCGIYYESNDDFKKDIKEVKKRGHNFNNPLEYLKYNKNEYMNILIILAYFSLVVDQDEEQTLSYLYQFASYFSKDIIEGDVEGLYNTYGFLYNNIVDEDDYNFNSNKTKILFKLLNNKKDLTEKNMFTYAVFLYGAICNTYIDDYKSQVNDGLKIIEELSHNNQSDAIYFLLILSSYLLENKNVFNINSKQLLLLGENNYDLIYPYIAFCPEIEESIRIEYLKKYINNKLDSYYDWRKYLPTIFKELKEEYEYIWGVEPFNTWCYSLDFLDNLDQYLTNYEINTVIKFLTEKEDQYNYEDIKSKYMFESNKKKEK